MRRSVICDGDVPPDGDSGGRSGSAGARQCLLRLLPFLVLAVSLAMTGVAWFAMRSQSAAGRLDYPADLTKPLLVLVLGSALSLCLFGLVMVLVGSRTRAAELAQRMTLALRESEERYRSVFNSDAVAFLLTDLNGRVVEANGRAAALFGYPRSTLCGLDVKTLVAPERHAAVEQHLLDFREGKRLVAETTVVRADGTRLPVEVHSALVAYGGENHVLAIIKDVSARKCAEVRLKQAYDELEDRVRERTLELQAVNADLEREMEERKRIEMRLHHQQRLESIGTLASGVAHEINNPVTGVMNYAELIRADAPEHSRIHEYAGEIVHESERIAAIVRSLLTFARHERQERSPVQVQELVDSSLKLLRTLMRHEQITLSVDVPEDLPPVHCRSQQMQQVLMNLVINARDALRTRDMGEAHPKCIDLRCRVLSDEGRDWLRVTVADNGPGLSHDLCTRIFDPFFTTKSRHEGTGLGLSISHGIVTEHGGRISVESEPGRYASFHVDLPVMN